jgi:hypothetical protein
MNGMKTEEAGSRKKYLAPLIVIMLCLVALTGAAYAYTTSVTSTQNGVTADYISIDLYNADGSGVVDAPVAESNVNVVTFKTDVTKADHKITITAVNTDKLIAKAYVKVSEDMSATKSKLTITPTSPTMSGILEEMTVTVAVSKVLDGSTEIEAQEGKYEVTNGNLITIELSATVTGGPFEETEGVNYANAAAAALAYKNAFVTQAKYSISVEAEPVTA